MKKFLVKLLVAFSLLLCILAGVACSASKEGIKVDINKAENALREKGYDIEVEYDTSYWGIDGIIEKAVFAEKDVNSYEDIYIEIYLFENEKVAKALYESWKAETESELNCLKAELKVNETILNEYRDIIKSTEIDELEDEIKEYKKEIEEIEEGLKCMGINGRCVWWVSHSDVLNDIA